MGFEVDCLVNDGKFNHNPHQNSLFKRLSKEISTNCGHDLAKLRFAIASDKNKRVSFDPIFD